MDWRRDGADWPNRAHSAFVKSDGITWHVQRMGNGPVLLLAHGTGAATHSWRDLMPALARHFTVIAPDLPGHGFTSAPPRYRLTLPDMAAALQGLLAVLAARPAVLVGHSAGAAILARLALDGDTGARLLVSLNGALLPITGLHGRIFSGTAKLLALMPAVPWFFAWRAGNLRAVTQLIESTGSRLDAAGMEYYRRLLSDPVHVSNVLAMMANWEQEKLMQDLPRLAPHLLLVAADGDHAVPPSVARDVARFVPGAESRLQAGLGHLSHEEAPRETAAIIVEAYGRLAAPPRRGVCTPETAA